MVGPEGEPVRGAEVFMISVGRAELPPPKARAVTNGQGGLRFSVARTEFTNSQSRLDPPWLSSYVLARAGGYGPDWLPAACFTSPRELAQDDVALEGRLLDSEDRAIGGVFALAILGAISTPTTGTAGPLSLDEIKSRLEKQQEKIENTYIRISSLQAQPSQEPLSLAPRAYREAPEPLAALEAKIAAAVEKARPSVVRIAWFDARAKVERSGSGVIVTADGYVVGARPLFEDHNLSPGKGISVHLADGRCVPGVTMGSSKQWGFSLVRITQDGPWPDAEFGRSAEVKPGEVCLALGYPPAVRVGQFPHDRSPSLRVGRATTTGLTHWLATSCRIDFSGDSGGGLFDLDGRLIGIHVLYHHQEQMARHRPVEIIEKHWRELASRKSAAAGGTGGQFREVPRPVGKPPSPPLDDPRLAPAVAKAEAATVAIDAEDPRAVFRSSRQRTTVLASPASAAPGFRPCSTRTPASRATAAAARSSIGWARSWA